MDPSEKNIKSLCNVAFKAKPKDAERSTAALRSLANILLLHKETRQNFADAGYPSAVANRLRVDGDERDEEMICSRLLFLLTYDTKFDFNPLFEECSLSNSVHHNITYHASKYAGEDLINDAFEKGSPTESKPVDNRALTESLKLLFNLSQFYPTHIPEFTKTIPSILTILDRIQLPTPTFQPPVTHLIHALLNLDLPGEPTGDTIGESNALFPAHSPRVYVDRMISILEAGLQSERKVELLESGATPLISVLRRVNAIAPAEVREVMQESLLPAKDDRSRPLGKTDSLPSCLLRLSTSPSAPNLKDAVSSLLFELSDTDPVKFIRNVGYGYAAGFLMTHKIQVPDKVFEEGGTEATHVNGHEINPITGQRRDMEPVDLGPEMTDEEKEREAERLFVLFERLKATGVVSVQNPVQAAQQEGRFEEVD